jgi:hypothetical protein
LGWDAAAAGDLDVTNWAGTTELDFAEGETLTIQGSTFSVNGTSQLRVGGVLVASDPFTDNTTSITYTFPADATGTIKARYRD